MNSQGITCFYNPQTKEQHIHAWIRKKDDEDVKEADNRAFDRLLKYCMLAKLHPHFWNVGGCFRTHIAPFGVLCCVMATICGPRLFEDRVGSKEVFGNL